MFLTGNATFLAKPPAEFRILILNKAVTIKSKENQRPPFWSQPLQTGAGLEREAASLSHRLCDGQASRA